MFGHKPDIISSRVMDYTYGIEMYGWYDENKHPVGKKLFREGKWMAEHFFEIFVMVNDDVPVDSKVYCSTTPGAEISVIPIYRTKVRDPVFITDPGCELLGTLEIENDKDMPLEEQTNKTTFIFGDTELLIEIKNISTGKVETLTLDVMKQL
ncbi:hypothetical protein DPMN_135042 [Dreissena polymorpha]|uniref:Uncharacterized protein n=1 Tax=Dreissena polymorpha TaxID=45954 RepID=A0A9D4JFF1_DREPO|nr:hypothetical protein DPMN_135042 [Dreissena polymorpha]